MQKQAIKKPGFGKTFGINFLIWLGVFTVIAVISLVLLGKYLSAQRSYRLNSLRSSIREQVEDYYASAPGSGEQDRYLQSLKNDLYMYSMLDHNYAEVTIGDMHLATDSDTARLAVPAGNGEETEEFYIEDMSYLERAEEYMTDFINKYRLSNQYTYDPIYSMILLSDNMTDKVLFCHAGSVYVDRAAHTFLPGVVVFENNAGERYEVDCTPSDTAGYEMIDLSSESGQYEYSFIYRLDPDLTPESSDLFILSTPVTTWGGYTKEELENELQQANVDQELPWHIIYTDTVERSVFDLAPVTSCVILILYLVLALLISFIISLLKYQKEKTVWNIFEYRTKTTEAMAHDLKTPLAALQAYAENIEASADDPRKTREYSKNITDRVESMDSMITDLLSLSKGESGNIVKNIGSVGIMGLLNESLQAFPGLKASFKGEDLTLQTDRQLLKQAVDNLLSNCDRYGEKDSAIDIEISPESLSIINATAVTYDDVDSLKQPFVKGDDTRGHKGTGLGLSIAENNLNILGYKLELISEDGKFKAVVKFKG